MREIRKSGSTSGDVETAHGRRSKAPTSRKGRQPYDDYLNHRATPRLHYELLCSLCSFVAKTRTDFLNHELRE